MAKFQGSRSHILNKNNLTTAKYIRQINDCKFDIIVGIPTYNEADSIRNTVTIIDRGLVKYYPDFHSLIVNVDSKSTDGTNRVFISIPTKTPKVSLTSGEQLRGKGLNIFSLISISKEFGAKYIATIDADTSTITEKWVKTILDPIIQDRADFVTPVYTRNRYEGNTTNHFCFPLLYAWFGKQLSQPIGGDFGMNSSFADYVLAQQKPTSSFLYGIDIFLSTHAVGANFRVEEVFLGRKIHKPSFDKIIPMFQQVAATMIFVLSQYIDRRDTSKPAIVSDSKQRTDSFIQKLDQEKITFVKNYAIQNLRQLPTENAQKYLGLSSKKIQSIMEIQTLTSGTEWVEILNSLSDYIANNSINDRGSTEIAKTLSPFFFLRVLAYFEELEQNKKHKNIDALILNQAKNLRSLSSFSANR